MADTPRELPDMSKNMIGALAASAATAATAAEAAARLNAEILEFSRQRLDADAKTAEAILKAESLADILALQRDFMVSTLESYARETSKLGTMAMDLTRNVTDEAIGRTPKAA